MADRARETDVVPKLTEALRALGESTVRGVCAWMDQHYPRCDGRMWANNMVILGDYAIDDDGTPVSGVQNTPRFLLKTTPEGQRPARFRLAKRR